MSQPTASPRHFAESRMALVIAILVALNAIGLVFWYAGREQRAIRALPAQTRARLYAATRSQFDVSCVENAPDALRDQCVDLAERLLLFPECDEGCRLAAHPFVHSKVK